MENHSRRFQRSASTKTLRKAIFIFPEGETEEIYFYLLKQEYPKVNILPQPPKKKTSASQILSRVREFIKSEELGDGDNVEIWIVVDVDKNSKEDLRLLKSWAKEKSYYGLALSNPKFEYWLLLHFDNGHRVSSAKICETRLKKHLPNYNKKNLNMKKIKPRIRVAIENAKNKNHQCSDWYLDCHTTVSELVEKILDEEESLL